MTLEQMIKQAKFEADNRVPPDKDFRILMSVVPDLIYTALEGYPTTEQVREMIEHALPQKEQWDELLANLKENTALRKERAQLTEHIGAREATKACPDGGCSELAAVNQERDELTYEREEIHDFLNGIMRALHLNSWDDIIGKISDNNDERDALKARVAELEGEVERLKRESRNDLHADFSIDDFKRKMISCGLSSEHAGIATGMAAEYAQSAYLQGHACGTNQEAARHAQPKPRRMKANPDASRHHNQEHDETLACRLIPPCQPVDGKE
jgi:hypothetical protein